MRNILLIVTNTAAYASGNYKTGLWLSELTHMYHVLKEKGHTVTIASPKGGNVPVDPESLKGYALDKISKACWNDPDFRGLLAHSQKLENVSGQPFDLMYLAGGHGTMYDFPDDRLMQQTIAAHYENGKMLAAICHGLGGLLNVKQANGEYLIRNKTLTGFSWFEERLANRRKEVPFNLEAALKSRGARYKKSILPLTSHVEVHGNLITGQNPFSSKETARVIMNELEKTTPNHSKP